MSNSLLTLKPLDLSGYIIFTAILLYFLIKFFSTRRHPLKEITHVLFEDNPCPIFVFDPKTLQILAVNKASSHLYGYTQEELLSMTIDQFKPEADVPRLLEVIKSERSYSNGDSIWRHLTKEGKRLYVNITAETVKMGRKKVRWALIRDMTEVRKRELLLIESLKLYNQTKIETNDVLWKYDQKAGSIRLFGPVSGTFGHQLSHLDKGWVKKYIHPRDRKKVWQGIKERHNNICPFWRDQFRILCEDRTYKYSSIKGYCIYDEAGNLDYSFGSIHIIQREMEYKGEIKAQNELLREVAHMVSHDLRGPVASIKAMLMLLDQDEASGVDPTKELQYIKKAATLLDSVIHQIMEKVNKVHHK